MSKSNLVYNGDPLVGGTSLKLIDLNSIANAGYIGTDENGKLISISESSFSAIAGGDLYGTFPDPLVKEISGVELASESVPAHRRVACERGATIAGSILTQLNQGGSSVLGTDSDGRVVLKKVTVTSSNSPVGNYVATFKIAGSKEIIKYSDANNVYEITLTVIPKHNYILNSSCVFATVLSGGYSDNFLKFTLRDYDFNLMAYTGSVALPSGYTGFASASLQYFNNNYVGVNNILVAGKTYRFGIVTNKASSGNLLSFIGKFRDSGVDTANIKITYIDQNIGQTQIPGDSSRNYILTKTGNGNIVTQIPYIQLSFG